jgi:beta-ureidopropionase / N-carbamoyl-L-amino-acid hydrolase
VLTIEVGGVGSNTGQITEEKADLPSASKVVQSPLFFINVPKILNTCNIIECSIIDVKFSWKRFHDVRNWMIWKGWMMLNINEARLLADLDALAAIGQTPDGGVTRTALSAADRAGRAWFRERVTEAGLQFREDGAGNLSAILGDAGRTILTGSHLDSVPNGGRYDGALGVLCALEVLRTLSEAKIALPVRLEAISFTDEEGSVVSMLGSRALIGNLTHGDLALARSTLNTTGLTPESILSAARRPDEYLAFVEVHIEQGTRLEKAGIDIGVVTNIVGIRDYWLVFDGQANHSGTTPMPQRADALWGAAAFIEGARDLVMDRFSPGVVNCGNLTISPGAHNIVPGQVRLALEFRHGTHGQLDEMETVLLALAREVADQHKLALSVEEVGHVTPAVLDERVIGAIEYAADEFGLSHMRLLSFAGHDTQNMSWFTPSAMFFVPSVEGLSHNPQEFTRKQDVINGGNVLLHVLLRLIRDLS